MSLMDLFFQRIEAQLRSLEKQLDSKHLESMSIDGIIKEVKEERKKTLRRNAEIRGYSGYETRPHSNPLDIRAPKYRQPDSWA